MKLYKKLMLLGLSMLLAVCLVACSNKKNDSSDAQIPSKVTKKTTITFWNAMVGPLQNNLQALTKEFEKENPNIKVKLEYQGSYEDIKSKVQNTLVTPKNLPTIAQSYAGYLYTAADGNYLQDLTPYINNKGVGWGSLKNSNINTSLLKGAQIKGKQYGIPFNKSVEVLYYNKTLLDKYQIKVPTTMAELKKAAQEIYEKTNHQVVGAGFDNLSAYYTDGMKEAGYNFNDKINFTGSASKKIVKYYVDGIKKGYFMTAGSQKYLSVPFANEKVAMYVSASAGEAYVKKSLNGKFEYGIANRPSKYNMARGSDIYMFKQASNMQKAAAFKYIKFLTSKSSQLKWATETGYIPVNNTALNSSEYKNNKSMKSAPVVSQAMKRLYNFPVTKNSETTFNDLKSILEGIFSQSKKANLNSLLKTGKAKFDSDWKQ
ncbi:ABC transporter substrate-binding protein [Lactobacillus psittaci]|uniref:ABC-type sugar transport system, periplasmic component n=1 Tax=Lactobacillus psittaci DSM 15354 TaxID=1122152 RepID=A0A0R1S2L9_9LACO|nr:ABC transporter substrate-binding protein [Lactobacillus psittaci]KRL63260.1 ABC-type sugar transport system, periplasmic component [Lactobacillus psittaci DSM 15354]